MKKIRYSVVELTVRAGGCGWEGFVVAVARSTRRAPVRATWHRIRTSSCPSTTVDTPTHSLS